MSSDTKELSFFSYSSFFIISLIALAFGYWFTKMQLHAVSSDALASYPKPYLAMTLFKCYLTIIVFFSLSRFVLAFISAGKLSSLQIALTYSPLLLVYLHCPLYWIACSVIALQLLFLIAALRSDDYRRLAANYLADTMMFVVFFLCHLFLTTRFSPLHWKMAMLVAHGFNSEEIPVLAPVFRGFLLAKQFAFSYVDHMQWAGIMNPPITLSSTFMQLVTFIFDLPSVSYEAFHVVMMATYFTMAVLGSFGFYLFLKYAAKLHTLFAFLGGYLFFFSGSPLLGEMFSSDGGIFLSPFVVFPYALLFISLAFEKNNTYFAAWAGLALAAQFFLQAPHPEGTIYSILFYGIFSFGLLLFSRQLSVRRRIYLISVSCIAYFLLSAFSVAPILVDQLSGNMFVFAHTGDVAVDKLRFFIPYKAYITLLAIFTPLSILLLKIDRKLSPVFLSSLLLSVSLLGIICFTKNVYMLVKLIHVLHVGLHFWITSRIGVYFYVSVFIITMYGLNGLTQVISERIQRHSSRF